MTPQEALEALKIKQIVIEGKAVRVAKFFEGISVANEALEKQIPKKPLDIEGDYTALFGICPNCKNVVCDNEDYRYCNGCGQALDWSDSE